MSALTYSLVISTCERAPELQRALDSLAQQERLPQEVIIVDASEDTATRQVCNSFGQLPISYFRARQTGAAPQRNLGGEKVRTPLLAFMDDDVVLKPDVFSLLCAAFDADATERIGGVAGRIIGMEHPPPRGLLWWYYRLQAGYPHATYGGRLFGPAINCLPTYRETIVDQRIDAEWLHSTCVVYRTGLFLREWFPQFPGYSWMEDVHLSARIARTNRLYFHTEARFEHLSASSRFKRDQFQLARLRMHNQWVVARDVLKQKGLKFEMKFLVHRLFVTISILRQGGRSRWKEALGTWC